MYSRIEMSEMMMFKAASLKDAGKPFTKEAAMAKLACSETATYVAHQAIQVLIQVPLNITMDRQGNDRR